MLKFCYIEIAKKQKKKYFFWEITKKSHRLLKILPIVMSIIQINPRTGYYKQIGFKNNF